MALFSVKVNVARLTGCVGFPHVHNQFMSLYCFQHLQFNQSKLSNIEKERLSRGILRQLLVISNAGRGKVLTCLATCIAVKVLRSMEEELRPLDVRRRLEGEEGVMSVRMDPGAREGVKGRG